MSLPFLRAQALSDNVPTLTALANDAGFENVFSDQLASSLLPDDLVIAISVSGASVNVLRGIRLAGSVGAFTVGISGSDGGDLRRAVNLYIGVSSSVPGIVETIHLAIAHAATDPRSVVGSEGL